MALIAWCPQPGVGSSMSNSVTKGFERLADWILVGSGHMIVTWVVDRVSKGVSS